MRPQILYPLFAETTRLKGVGPRVAKLIDRLAGPAVIDLLWHLPTGVLDRRFSPTLAEAPTGTVVTLTLTVGDHILPRTPRQPYKVMASDGTGVVELVFFHAKGDYLAKLLPKGGTRIVSGRLDEFTGHLQMTHPDHVVPPEEADSVRRIEPVYGLTEGLAPRVLRKAIEASLGGVPELPEWSNRPLVAREGWPSWKAALLAAHNPATPEDAAPTAPARRRLAYDELLANQLALGLVRQSQKRRRGRSIAGDGRLAAKAKAALAFDFTGAQRGALAEIFGDMKSEQRMTRLLQGDVGSGKTVVALFAMLNAVECGCQAALMAPTEILARQHYATIEPLARAAGVRVALLTGRDKGKSREEALGAIAAGFIDILVGTHALFQEDVAFKDLALAVIDEQHRFGVHQRMALTEKGQGVDLLVMTATPIPRTLSMTVYGDLDSSRLTEKPPGRKPIDTRAVPLARHDEVVGAVGRALESGAKAYWVCPLVEESETVDMAAAEDRHRELAALFGPRVGLVHGRMKAAEKDAAMAAFQAGPVDLLVATTVIEVGVDVPEATVMVIEHAERFGLAQLHQLRGRIGRGDRPSTCLLLYQAPLGETARARLKVIRETEDGFRIAEEDLKLRGSGEVLGTRQAGLPTFRVADLLVHGDLLPAARDDARMVLDADPTLAGERGQAIRALLYLFERDAAVRFLQGG